jgi:hypothetical protein
MSPVDGHHNWFAVVCSLPPGYHQVTYCTSPKYIEVRIAMLVRRVLNPTGAL